MTAAVPLDRYLGDLRVDVESALERVLAASSAPTVIAGPMRYALIAPGKRLRPCLTLAAAEAAGCALDLPPATAHALALPAACAVEMIHSYSLVHDDLPAMDNDDMRRGRPTTHIVYGDGLAILAGDGLLTDAFDVIASAPSPASVPNAPSASADRRLQAVRVLARAAGATGMVGGQAIDLAAAGIAGSPHTALDATSLEDMHLRKTGALIRAATTMGAILVGANEETVRALDDYAREIGLAFQIVDDILDVEGSNADLGKTAGKDAAAGKPTFPAIYGMAHSRELAAACVARAHAALARAGLDGRLGEIAEWSLGRKK